MKIVSRQQPTVPVQEPFRSKLVKRNLPSPTLRHPTQPAEFQSTLQQGIPNRTTLLSFQLPDLGGSTKFRQNALQSRGANQHALQVMGIGADQIGRRPGTPLQPIEIVVHDPERAPKAALVQAGQRALHVRLAIADDELAVTGCNARIPEFMVVFALHYQEAAGVELARHDDLGGDYPGVLVVDQRHTDSAPKPIIRSDRSPTIKGE